MNAAQSKAVVGSTASAVLAQAALYGQLAWVELGVEKSRLLQILVLLLAGFSLLTSVLVAATIWLLLATWDTPWRSAMLAASALTHCLVFTGIGLRVAALTRQGNEAFTGFREELAEDFALLRSRLEQ